MPLSRFHIYLQEKGYKEPKIQETSPVAWAEGKEGQTLWEIIASDPERFLTFQKGLPMGDIHLPRIGYYDFGKLTNVGQDDRTLLVDIGGGIGSRLMDILTNYRTLLPGRAVLQDLPDVIRAARANTRLSGDVKLMEHDFYCLQPVQGTCRSRT